MALQANIRSVSRRVATDGVLCALAMILSYVEALVPLQTWIPVPGLRLGLANIAVLYCVLQIGFGDGVLVNLMRILLTSLLFGSITAFLFSMCGACCSMLFLWAAKRGYPRIFSPIGLSVGCALFHNLGQLCATAILYAPMTALSYAAWLLAIGLITGTLNGIITYLTLRGLGGLKPA